MARKNRFELVLDDDEYGQLEEASKAAGISKGAFVRLRLFGRMGDALEIEARVDAKMKPLEDLAKRNPAPKVVIEALPSSGEKFGGSGTIDAMQERAHSSSEIKRLAMQRYPHLPLVFAERKVREELG